MRRQKVLTVCVNFQAKIRTNTGVFLQVSDVVTKMQNTTVEFVDMLYGALKEN